MTQPSLFDRLGALRPAVLLMLVTSLALLCSPTAALAQDDVGSVAWLSGCWVADAGHERWDEVWIEPEGGLIERARLRAELCTEGALKASR